MISMNLYQFMLASSLLFITASGFTIGGTNHHLQKQQQQQQHVQLSPLFMFGGAGAGIPSEDNPEEYAQMVQAAKSMGMSVEEYKLGISARTRLTTELDNSRVTTGKTNVVTIERDGNNPPKFLTITVTENGKQLGPNELSNELVKGLKAASDLSRTKRTEAQKNMMTYIGDEMKKLGA